MTEKIVSHDVKKFAAKAGIERVAPHDLRRTCAKLCHAGRGHGVRGSWSERDLRGVDYDGGCRAHLWAKEAGFEIAHVAAYHPHYLNGPHKGFWNWTLRNATLRLVEKRSLSKDRWKELVDGMTATDNSPHIVVAHCRMHQLIATKPGR